MDEHRPHQDNDKDGAASRKSGGSETPANKAKDIRDAAGDLGGQVKDAAGKVIDQGKQAAGGIVDTAGDMLSDATSKAKGIGEQAWSVANQARDQIGAAADTIYRQSAPASEYLSRNVEQNPLTALLVAGAVGYALAYLIHAR